MANEQAGGETQNQNQGGEQQQQQQQQVESWTTKLDPELQKSPSAAKFKGKNWDEVGPQIFKSYHNLERWQIPSEDPKTPEEKAAREAFHRRLGIPEKVEDYSKALKVEVPNGVPWNDEIQGAFATFAHAEGITPAQASKVLNFYLSRAGQGVDMQTTEKAEDLKKAHEGLKERWGASYERNVGLVHRTIEEYGSDEFNTLLDTKFKVGDEEFTLGSHPAMLEFIARHGEGRLEAGFIQGNSLLTSHASAQSELSSILDNPEHPYWKGDKSALKRVQELLAITEAPKRAR